MTNKTGIPHITHGNSTRTVQRTGSDYNVSKALLLTSTNINPVSFFFVRDDEKIRFLSRITGLKLALGLRSWKWRIRAKPYIKISPPHTKKQYCTKASAKGVQRLKVTHRTCYRVGKTNVSHEMKIAAQRYFFKKNPYTHRTRRQW